jgi:hypothetical protein
MYGLFLKKSIEKVIFVGQLHANEKNYIPVYLCVFYTHDAAGPPQGGSYAAASGPCGLGRYAV